MPSENLPRGTRGGAQLTASSSISLALSLHYRVSHAHLYGIGPSGITTLCIAYHDRDLLTYVLCGSL